MAALSASRFVWLATSLTMFVMLPICDACSFRWDVIWAMAFTLSFRLFMLRSVCVTVRVPSSASNRTSLAPTARSVACSAEWVVEAASRDMAAVVSSAAVACWLARRWRWSTVAAMSSAVLDTVSNDVPMTRPAQTLSS